MAWNLDLLLMLLTIERFKMANILQAVIDWHEGNTPRFEKIGEKHGTSKKDKKIKKKSAKNDKKFGF